MSEYGIKLKFNEKGVAICKDSQDIYIIENGLVHKKKS